MWTVDFLGTNADPPDLTGVPAEVDPETGNLVLPEGGLPNSQWSIISAWQWVDKEAPSNTEKFVFGQIYEGDPDGAGGFGGSQDPPPERNP